MTQHQPFHLWKMPVKPQGRAYASAHYRNTGGYARGERWYFTWEYPQDADSPPGPPAIIYPPPFHTETRPTREAIAYLEAVGFKVFIDGGLQGWAAEPPLGTVARLFEEQVRELRREAVQPLSKAEIDELTRAAAEAYLRMRDHNTLRGLPDYVQRAIDVLLQGYEAEQARAVGEVASLSAAAAPTCAGVPFSDDDIPF